MSRIHCTLPATLVALALAACGDRQPSPPAPELIVINADVRTVDSALPRAR